MMTSSAASVTQPRAAAAAATSAQSPHMADNSPQGRGVDGKAAAAAKQPHQWSTNPVEEWAKEQVCQWLLALGMESYITLFMDKTITGAALLNLDSSGLKDLGIKNKEDREKIKKKIKELKSHNEREKRDMERKAENKGHSSMGSKAASARENLLKKAEKVINKKK